MAIVDIIAEDSNKGLIVQVDDPTEDGVLQNRKAVRVKVQFSSFNLDTLSPGLTPKQFMKNWKYDTVTQGFILK